MGGPVVDVPVVRFTTDGRIADTIGAYPRVRRGDEVEYVTVARSSHTVPRPPDTQRRVVRTPDGLVFIDLDGIDATARVRLTRLTYAGDTVRTSDFAYDDHVRGHRARATACGGLGNRTG